MSINENQETEFEVPSKTVVISGEEKYVSIFKGDKFVQRARVNLFTVCYSIYHVYYRASLNGHSILDFKIDRLENPNYIITDK